MAHLAASSAGARDFASREATRASSSSVDGELADSEAMDERDQPGLSRRQFLKISALGALGLTYGGGLSLVMSACTPEELAKIANRPMRRDINSLSPTDPILNAYRAAVTAMKALPSSDPRNWTKQAEIHLNHCTHGNWLFLPWHRAYLRYFEEICREMSGYEAFALPYWNWSKDRQVPPVFWDASSSLYDSTRTITSTSTLTSGVFDPSYIETILDETNFLNFGSDQISATTDQTTIVSYGPMEGGPHNSVHGFIGGDMGAFMSPLDPVFWTHHNMIDCMWVEWNLRRGNPNTNDPAWTNRKFTDFVDRTGAPVEVQVIETILYPYFLYRFDDPVLGIP
jgi:tyrosinase